MFKSFASKPAPTLVLSRVSIPCGSGLAREGVLTGNTDQRLPSSGSRRASSASSRPLPPPMSSSSTMLRSQSA
ncbi:hypothetical protein C1894_16990 [Pseudomonas sp. FW305-3-2-15-E-TSA2]|nr:hypothetical protein C1895_16870 [Pseudomonas sp. FW305-3-2-15-E-TSA4]POA41064.1 hypothetical protein C1894_16990 [Pseudomonas sp. FW305-3-2-15-E-TSA2]